MTTTTATTAVTQWLMHSDPAIGWQVMRDLLHEPEAAVAAERSKVATQGWGARLLDLQDADGQWGGGTYFPQWTSTTHSLALLRGGLDYLRDADVEPDERCSEAIGLVERKRGPDGRWLVENPHPGEEHFEVDDVEGRPSRWITLRALRVLDWYEKGLAA